MNCFQSHDLLQQRLDGEPIDDRATLEKHLAECPECRGLHAAAVRLEDGLRLCTPPVPPIGLQKVIVAAALADRRARKRTRRLWISAAAIAASLLLLVLNGYLGSGASDSWLRNQYAASRDYVVGLFRPAPVPVTVIILDSGGSSMSMRDDWPEPLPTVPSVRDSVAEASSAVVSLTRRTADETREQTRFLTEALPMPGNVFEALPPAREQPVTAALQETGQRVATGFEPVTSSARRALSMFLRESPAPPVSQ
jgi:hypothetical protein